MSAPSGVRSSTPDRSARRAGPARTDSGTGPPPALPQEHGRRTGSDSEAGRAARPFPPVSRVVSAGFGERGGEGAGGHCALSAAVGGVRDARIAGYSPATAPMTTVTASPARTTSIGRAKSHPLTAVMP